MDCLKCNCGCDGLSKDELEEMINVTERVSRFIVNETACQMLYNLAYPDETQAYEPQPSSSQMRPVRKPPKPNAIKYLEILKECNRLLQTTPTEEDREQLADCLPLALGDELLDNTKTDHKDVLEKIVKEYSARLSEQELYKRLMANLVEAYQGKLKLEK